MGGVSEAIARSARSFGAEIRTNARVSRVLVRGGQVEGVVLENGEEIRARWWSPRCTRRSRSSTSFRATNCPRTSSSDIEHWKTRSGVVKINLALAELPNFTADPSYGHGRTPHRFGRDGAHHGVHRGRVPGGPRRQARATCPFSDGVIPTTLDKTLNPDGTHIMSLFTQWVPAEWADEPHTEELEAYADRVIDTLRPGRAGLQGLDHAPRRRRPARDGAGVRPDRRQHLPRRAVAGAAVPHAARARATPTTARRSPGCTTAARPPMRAAACAASPAGRPPRPRSLTRSERLKRFRSGRRPEAQRRRRHAGGAVGGARRCQPAARQLRRAHDHRGPAQLGALCIW